MSRAIWFVGGAAVGVYAMLRGRKAAEALTADGLRDRMQALSLGARLVREEVAQGKAEKESELRARLLPAYDSSRQLPAGSTDLPSLPDGHPTPGTEGTQ
jgi:hypothetical protein